jgi:molybdate transport system ATP-binding protein
MIEIDIHKKLHGVDGLMDLQICTSVKKNQLVTLYGASGTGKTTTLRMLAGLTNPDSGTIKVNNNRWFDAEQKINLKPQRRKVGFVFQDFALFPNMTVHENLKFGLLKGQPIKLLEELIEITELGTLQQRKPHTLSGGQKQRVALSRALVQQPDILLLDEPLSALDDEMRFKLQDYILQVHKHFQLTTILVSHNLSEIFKLSDKVIVLQKGKIQKEGTPEAVFSQDKLSSKFNVTGEILKIEKSDVIYIVSVLSGNTIVKVVATKNEAEKLTIGQKILVASKAFNPIIKRL